jgi:hypothetical protein
MHDPHLRLFLNDRDIALRQGLHRMIHPVRREETAPVLAADGQEEGTGIGYASVVRDPRSGLSRIWYSCHVDDLARLAVSEDGTNWLRQGPAVVDGHRFRIDNLALVPVGPEADGWFKDAQLAGFAYCKGSAKDQKAVRGLHLIRWRDGELLEIREPGILSGVGDRSSLTYDDLTGEYLLISRPSGQAPGFRTDELDRPRVANLWKSRNLIDWENQGIILKHDDSDPHDLQIYGLQPFRYGNGFLALVEVYHQGIERLDTQLASSSDGIRWERVGDRTPTIPLGGEGGWDSHWTVSTYNAPFPDGDRLQIYYIGAGTKHGSGARHRRGIGLASIRKDGWVSLEAGREDGVMATPPLPLQAEMRLEVNVNAFSGYFSAEVWSVEENRPLRGYEGNASRVEGVDSTRHVVAWRDKRAVSPIEGGRCYLRFSMKQASFFSYRWIPDRSH